MVKNTENKEEITFNEFRAWLNGVIRGKRGELPDLQDWKQIKIMMDKVEDGVKYQKFPTQPTHTPPIYIDPPPPNMYPQCTTSSYDNVNFGELNIEIPELKEPSIGNIADIKIANTPQTSEEFDKNVEEFGAAIDTMLKTQDEKYDS